MNRLKKYNLFAYVLFAITVAAQKESPRVDYSIIVDTADLSGYSVEMHIHNAPHVFKLAMATHHEYDDRFWRYVQSFKVIASGKNSGYVKTDSALWQISIPGHEAVVSYRIHLPQQGQFHFAHRPFLSLTGGLVGDIHSFMYMPGNEQIPSTVTFQLPRAWQIATGLEPTNNSHVFKASSAETLLDCPVLTGHLHKWNFVVNGVKHTIAYLPVADAAAFDTATLVRNIKKIVQQAVNVFGSMPYKQYTFLLEDGREGALEHHNSVTLGAPSTMLATNMKELYEELAHEFFHSWNLVSIKPAEYTPLNYGVQETSEGLWFSEGFTMFYSDLLVRRAGLPIEDSADITRCSHLRELITRYYADTGNMVISPAKTSLVSNAAPGMLGDYEASVHLQGELLGAMLDFIIRDASNNQKSLDDLMKLMFKRFGNHKGFYATDIEQAVKDICLCSEEVHSFFKKYVYDGSPIDFNKYLNLASLQFQLSYLPAKNADGKLSPDLRVYIWQPVGDSFYHIGLTNPVNCWTKAGIHTGDVIIRLNNKPVNNRQDFYNIINSLQINDTLLVKTWHGGMMASIPVVISGYNKPLVRITKITNSNSKQQKLLKQWEQGN